MKIFMHFLIVLLYYYIPSTCFADQTVRIGWTIDRSEEIIWSNVEWDFSNNLCVKLGATKHGTICLPDGQWKVVTVRVVSKEGTSTTKLTINSINPTDFDHDGDTDGKDLETFMKEFGR